MEPRQSKNSTKNKVGIVTDPDMTLHRCQGGDHPERPERLTAIVDHLKQTKLLDSCTFINKLEECSDEHIQTLHPPEYVKYVKDLCKNYKEEEAAYADTYYNKSTDMCARKALQGAKILADKVMAGELQSGYGILRPPGHHAAAKGSFISGFCIYSTIALTAKYVKEKYKLKKILIFDWDVHHGDSTQKFLYEDAEILFISLHRFDKGYFYPGPSGDIENVGEKDGEGFNLNLPWDSSHKYGKVGDSEYIYVFERIAYPIIKAFNPELIFVSAGFDSGRGDPLGGLDLTQDGYAYMLRKLQLVQPRIIIGLEGGYNLETISRASEACVRVLLGEQLPLSCADRKLNLEELRETATPNASAHILVEKALKTFGKYWSEVLYSKDLLEYEELIAENVRYNVLNRLTGPKLFRLVGDKYLRALEEEEEAFFEQVSKAKNTSPKALQDLKKWVVKYYGKEVLDGKEYLAFEKYVFSSVTECQAFLIQVYPPEKENSLHASIILRAEFDSNCNGGVGAVSTGEEKVAYADLATLSKMEKLEYDPFDWKQFSENHKPPKESLKGYEKIVECVRAAEVMLQKDPKTKSLAILVITNITSVLDVKIIHGGTPFNPSTSSVQTNEYQIPLWKELQSMVKAFADKTKLEK